MAPLLSIVGLAAVAGAVRGILQHDGERPPPQPLQAMVPGSMRRLGDTTAGNQISMITIALLVHLDSAIARLGCVREQTKRLKQTDRPIGTQNLYKRSACCRRRCDPGRPRRWQHRGSSTSPSHNRRPREDRSTSWDESSKRSTPSSPSPSHALAIGTVRYRHELFFGCYADPDAVPEVHQLPTLIEAELQELGRTATRPRAGNPPVTST